jgi:uracil-DNA glycosylase family 4
MRLLADEISSCRRCRRLVAWREQVAVERRAAFADQDYWGRPVPGFGDPAAAVLILGLAPAAHGANRTGRMFTGDRSGDFLFAALWRTGFANQPQSTARGDGLVLRGAFVSAAVRCAPPENRPTPTERDTCMDWTLGELQLLAGLQLVVCLGAFAWQAAWRVRALLQADAQQSPARGSDAGEPPARRARRRAAPRFAHGAEVVDAADGCKAPFAMLGCFHPSQQNTFTGRLTEPMIDAVLQRARVLAGLTGTAGAQSR